MIVNGVIDIIKSFGLFALSFIVAMFLTPVLTHVMYKYKLWRKEVRTVSPDGSKTPLFAKLHKDRETRVPRLGGALIWITTLFLAFSLWSVAQISSSAFWTKATFLSRNQTWLPIFTLVASSLLGLADDLFQVLGKGSYVAGGIKFRHRLFVVFLIALTGAVWFYYKLDGVLFIFPGMVTYLLAFGTYRYSLSQ